ncbi:MAG: DUF1361 domain-containing protein [Candidatus Roizmanbacteria bacterium]
MDILSFNQSWMSWNFILAVISVFLILASYLIRQPYIKIPLLIIWLLFVPNSIYILTDIIHFQSQWDVIPSNLEVWLVVQYAFFLPWGIITHIANLYYFELLLEQTKFIKKRARPIVILILQFLIALGLIMGRNQRTNSWHVITQPWKVIRDVFEVIMRVDLFIYILISWIFLVGIYVIYKKSRTNSTALIIKKTH